MTYDPRKQLGSEPEPELIRHAQAFNAMFAVGGLLLLFLLIFWRA